MAAATLLMAAPLVLVGAAGVVCAVPATGDAAPGAEAAVVAAVVAGEPADVPAAVVPSTRLSTPSTQQPAVAQAAGGVASSVQAAGVGCAYRVQPAAHEGEAEQTRVAKESEPLAAIWHVSPALVEAEALRQRSARATTLR